MEENNVMTIRSAEELTAALKALEDGEILRVTVIKGDEAGAGGR